METSSKVLTKCIKCNHAMWRRSDMGNMCQSCRPARLVNPVKYTRIIRPAITKAISELADRVSQQFPDSYRLATYLVNKASPHEIKSNTSCNARLARRLRTIHEVDDKSY